MWYVSRINTLDSRVLAARYFVNISILFIRTVLSHGHGPWEYYY